MQRFSVRLIQERCRCHGQHRRRYQKFFLLAATAICLATSLLYLATVRTTLLTTSNNVLKATDRHVDSWSSAAAKNHSILQAKLRHLLYDANNTSSMTTTPLPLPPHTPGVLIHLGKTGGSSITSKLRHGCHSWVRKPCRTVSLHEPESTISYLTTYIHTPDLERIDKEHQTATAVSSTAALHDKNSTEMANTNAKTSSLLHPAMPHYLFTVMTIRDPMARLLSAFIFEHPANEQAVPVMRRRFQAVFACFPSLQSFANALGDYDDSSSSNNATTTAACQRQARAMMNHGVRDSMHFYYDYRLVARLLLGYDDNGAKTKPTDTVLLVLRTESLWTDWARANAWLVGDDEDFESIVSPQNASDNSTDIRLRDTSQKKLIVDKTLDDAGRVRLCQALREEYRVYLLLIRRAVNLSPQEQQVSIEQAMLACPELDWAALNDLAT